MTVWRSKPVDKETLVELSRWRLLQVESGKVHLVGFRAERCTARVSTAVRQFDSMARCARTNSGRIYKLVGPPRIDADADYVWTEWVRANGVVSWSDVSASFIDGAPPLPGVAP